ncbi:permease [Clostridium sp.]|uniref:permease n=1 Tax=Clostridium sp. TaxID=1506 RepID=UPI00285279B4|nr:permease [Clostridium sp.]
MNTKVEIVIGFLGSGKTSFINSKLQGEELQDGTIVVIQDEFGNCEIKNSLNNQNQIIVIKTGEDEEISADYIKKIISIYTPNRIFIETNGMKESTHIINIFNDKEIRKICKIDDIISVIDVIKFPMYFRNMKSIVSTHIFNSETIILNNTNQLEKKEFLSIQKEIENINETANMLEHVSGVNNGKSNEEEYEGIERDNISIFNAFFYASLGIFLFIVITLVSLNIKIYGIYLDRFKKFYDVFISILIQGFPFILIGSFVSSIIQICISRDTFIKIFSKNIFLSCIIAAFAGLLFPICDCGTIPIVKGLMKKKIPIAAGITFMLAAPIVNPIAIIATIYAFPEMKSVAIYRYDKYENNS